MKPVKPEKMKKLRNQDSFSFFSSSNDCDYTNNVRIQTRLRVLWHAIAKKHNTVQQNQPTDGVLVMPVHK